MIMFKILFYILSFSCCAWSGTAVAVTAQTVDNPQDLVSKPSSFSEEMVIGASHLKAQSAFQIRHFQQLVDDKDWATAGEVFEKVKRVEDRRGE